MISPDVTPNLKIVIWYWGTAHEEKIRLQLVERRRVSEWRNQNEDYVHVYNNIIIQTMIRNDPFSNCRISSITVTLVVRIRKASQLELLWTGAAHVFPNSV
jgi:hypothetical protein